MSVWYRFWPATFHGLMASVFNSRGITVDVLVCLDVYGDGLVKKRVLLLQHLLQYKPASSSVVL